jgi:apolipoprotein N-acyltransferase
LRFPTNLLSGRLGSVNRRLLPHVRTLAALGCGLVWTAAFPRWNVPGLGWIAPGLLLGLTLGQRPGVAFRLGYLAGLACYLGSLHWLLYNPFPVGAAAGWLALSAYLALYPATWVWFCGRLSPRGAAAPNPANGEVPLPAAPLAGFTIGSLIGASWGARARWACVCAVSWVAWEMIVGRLFSGFPWNPLGASQSGLTPLIQVAAVTGVYGVSFLVAWFSVALMLAGLRLIREPGRRWVCMSEMVLPMLAVALAMAWGFRRIQSAPAESRSLKVALVQPSIPQVLIWDHHEDSNRFAQVMELSRLALAGKPDLLVWPEAAMPSFTEENYQALTNLVATHHAWLVFGADDFERRAGTTDPDDGDAFNAAFLLNREGRYVSRYRKQQLVIFGEYVPLARWLPFLKHLTPVGVGFAEGAGPVEFTLADGRATASVLICFEDVFPHLGRRNVTADTDFLLNLTNDGWFGESAAHWQQAVTAVFRAVENGVPLVRCTNNGLTCWIDGFGRLRQILATEGGSVYGPGFMAFELPLPPEGVRAERTFYHRHGDWFAWSCVALVFIALAIHKARQLASSQSR